MAPRFDPLSQLVFTLNYIASIQSSLSHLFSHLSFDSLNTHNNPTLAYRTSTTDGSNTRKHTYTQRNQKQNKTKVCERCSAASLSFSQTIKNDKSSNERPGTKATWPRCSSSSKKKRHLFLERCVCMCVFFFKEHRRRCCRKHLTLFHFDGFHSISLTITSVDAFVGRTNGNQTRYSLRWCASTWETSNFLHTTQWHLLKHAVLVVTTVLL